MEVMGLDENVLREFQNNFSALRTISTNNKKINCSLKSLVSVIKTSMIQSSLAI